MIEFTLDELNAIIAHEEAVLDNWLDEEKRLKALLAHKRLDIASLCADLAGLGRELDRLTKEARNCGETSADGNG